MNKIIIAMDNEIEDGIDLIRKTQNHKGIYGYKIGSMWVLEEGVKVLLRCREHFNDEKKIILDMQKWGTDIPEIVTKQVNRVSSYVDEIIACPMGAGNCSLKAFASACKNNSVAPISVIEMTHPTSDVYLDKHHTSMILSDCVEFEINKIIVPATKELSLYDKDLIASWKLQKNFEFDKYAMGFKAQGGQIKPMVDFGVTKFIIGRAIYEAEDPIKAIDDLYKEINVK